MPKCLTQLKRAIVLVIYFNFRTQEVQILQHRCRKVQVLNVPFVPARFLELLQEDAFTLQLPDLGLLTHLGVKLDGSGQRPAWHLDKVCIIPPAITTALPATAHGNTANGLQLLGPTGAGGRDSGGSPGCTGQPVWFVAQKWFDAVHGLEALLEAQAVDPADSFVPYQVEVYTSDIK